MKVPDNEADLIRFARETVDECTMSQPVRRQSYDMWRHIFYTGSNDEQASKHNRIYAHVDKLSSYLFSPAEVRFMLDFEESDSKEWKAKADKGSRWLNRMFSRREVDTACAEANLWALVNGCTILRVNWERHGFDPWVIQPGFFGVRNETIPDLDRQDAFTHTTLMSETALKRLLTNHRDRKSIMDLIGSAFDAAASELADSYMGGGITGLGAFNPLTMTGGGIQIPGMTTASAAGNGAVDFISAPPVDMLAPDVRMRLIRFHELWVWDDEREDWTTIHYVEPGIILEGKYQHRNLCGVKGTHPFIRFCSNEVPNYFWGRSEIANVWKNQQMLSARINNVDQMYRLNADPPRVFRGFSGMNETKAKALLSPGAILADGAPSGTTAVDTLERPIPQGYLEYISKIEQWFEESAGFTAITSGQGEPGVRAGVHANTLLRTSTPRLRDRALLIEKQVAKVGEVCFSIAAHKDATTLTASDGTEFLLSQLPDDCSVVVDSHTSSPAFSGEAEQKAFMLHKANAIDNVDLIRLTHVPNEDQLIENERARQKDHAALLEQVRKQDPDTWIKMVSGTGSKRR